MIFKSEIRQDEKIAYKLERKQNFLFTGDMTIHLDSINKFFNKKKVLQQKSEFVKLGEHKSIYKDQLYFYKLPINKWKTKTQYHLPYRK